MPHSTERANRRADIRHKHGLDAKETDAYSGSLSMLVAGLFSSSRWMSLSSPLSPTPIPPTPPKGYQPRHAAIVSHQLCIYKQAGDANPIERISLANAHFEFDEEDLAHRTFKLQIDSKKAYTFQCADRPAAKAWQSAIARAIGIASARR